MRYRTILVHRPKNLVSKGIRFFTNSYWNHSAIQREDGTIIEAVFPKVREIGTYDFIKEYKELGCSFHYCNWYESDIDFSFYLNKPYQIAIFYRQPIYYALSYKFGKNHWSAKLFNNFNNDSRWFCHELSAHHRGMKQSHLADGRYFSNLDKNGKS